MKNGRGFTLVELLAAITIMGILLVISVISLRNIQIDARDTERKTDIENISRALETYYTNNQGSYPITGQITGLDTATATLRGTNADTFRAPGITTGTSFVPAQNTSATTNVLSPPFAETDYSKYVYQPFANNGGLCSSSGAECPRYKLIYRQERDSQLVVVESKNQ